MNNFVFKSIVLLAFFGVANLLYSKTWEITSWSSGTRDNRLTQAVNRASDGDILELQNNITVNSDIEVRKQITIKSKDGNTYKIINRGYTYGVKIHPGGTLAMTNVIYDCDGMSQVEDVFLLMPQTISGSTTNVARMVLNNGASIRNALLSSSTKNENAVIHIKEGAVFRINAGAEIINCVNNSNPGKGGAICCDYGTVIMTGGTIAGCTAKGAGGAIHTDGTRVDSADHYGINARGDIYISGGYITNNTCGAGLYGGAIYLGNSGPMLHITGSTVISNNFSGVGDSRIADDVSTYLLQNAYANRLKLVDHDDSNPLGFSYEGIKFTGSVGVRYPDVSEMKDPQHTRFGAVWEYFAGTQEEPRLFFWNGNNAYRGRLDGNALVWTSHITHELPKDGEKIKELIEAGELSPLYVELNDDYEMTVPVNVPKDYEIVIDLQGHNFNCDFHVSNETARVIIRDSSIEKSGTVTGHRESDYPSAFVLEGGSYQTKPKPEWIAPNRVLVGNYCSEHPYMVAIIAWEADQECDIADLTRVPLEQADNEVRDVIINDDGSADIAKITYSSGDWQFMQYTNIDYRVQVLAAPACSNEVTGVIAETGSRVLLFDSHATSGTQNYGREGEFEWDAKAHGLVKLIHVTMRAQGESYITNDVETAYLRFPDPNIKATQRNGGLKLPIMLADSLLALFGYNRVNGFSVDEVGALVDTFDDNGLRKWENIVTGTASDELLLSTASGVDGGIKLNITLTNAQKTPRSDMGYSVLYAVSKFSNGQWVRLGDESSKPKFQIDLLDADGKSKNASGFYRVSTLIVANGATIVTNEIASSNIIGVMEVASALKNTLTAVPWTALPTGTQSTQSPIALGDFVNTSHLEDADSLQVADNGHIYRKWQWNKGAKKWEGAINVSSRGIVPAPSAHEHMLERNHAVWVSRNNPEAKPFFLIGQYSSNQVILEIQGGSKASAVCTLVPNPSMKDVKVNEYAWGANPLAGVNGDIIRIPNEQNVPLNLTWNGTEWGRYVKAPGGRGSVWNNSATIPAGTGFWYIRRGDKFDLTLPIAEIE